MNEESDISVHLPAEHFAALSEVILTGLKRANIDPEMRRQLQSWWEAECEFIRDELSSESNDAAVNTNS